MLEVNNIFSGTSLDWLGYMIGIIPILSKGALTSIELAVCGLIGGFILGILLAIAKLYGKGVIRLISVWYIEFFRGTPMLLQLFLIYFGLPEIGISFDRYIAVIISLALNSAAYQAEYFRGGLNAIDDGQIIAARTLGMNFKQAFLKVVFPQLFRIILPSWSNEVIYIVKYAAIAFTVAVPDIMAYAKMLITYQFRPVEVFIVVSLIYIVLLSVIGSVMGTIEKKFSVPGLILDSARS